MAILSGLFPIFDHSVIVVPWFDLRVDDVDFELTPLNEFDKDGERISYVEYFRDRWGLEVTRPDTQPLLIHRSVPGSEKKSSPLCY